MQAPWPRHGTAALVLAPMEGVTDAPMRALFSERGGFSFYVAEFLRVSSQVPPAATLIKHVPELWRGCTTPSGGVVQVQLLGGDPTRLAATAALAVACGAPAIDLNFGCPARTVNRHDGGAALLKSPERIQRIVRAVRAAVPAHLPVSAKLRLGWDDIGDIDRNADAAYTGGAAWLTLHARTKAQGYKPPVFWPSVGRIRARLPVPVVANGDIWSLSDLQRCRDITGCEHFMLGRGAMADPNLPRQAAACLGLSAAATPEPKTAWPTWLARLHALTLCYEPSTRHLPGRFKQWLKMSHLRSPNDYYERIKTLGDVDAILDSLGGGEGRVNSA